MIGAYYYGKDVISCTDRHEEDDVTRDESASLNKNSAAGIKSPVLCLASATPLISIKSACMMSLVFISCIDGQ